MRVTVRFRDGESMEGFSEAASLSRMGFPLVPDGGNNQLVWVSLAWVRYVVLHDRAPTPHPAGDPRESESLPKVVIHFLDGEMLRTYRDDQWGPDGDGFRAVVWDPQLKALVRILISPLAIKGIFFVRNWDSRAEPMGARSAVLGVSPTL